MTNQADSKINITIKEVELVEMGKEKHDETLAKIEAKADKVEFDDLKNTVSENQTQLQEQLQSQSDRINTKLDEVSVKVLIAEAELDDLTLEQVQQEVIKQVADKASTQAVSEANQAQDAKIDTLTKQLEQQQAEAVELEWDEEALLEDQTNVSTWEDRPKLYLKIGDYYVPFLKKKLFNVKKDVFALTLMKNQEYELSLENFVEVGNRLFNAEVVSDNDKVVVSNLSITITTAEENIKSTITSRSLDKDIVLDITVVDALDWQKVADSLEIKTVYGDKGVYVNEILPKHAPVDQIKYVFDREVLGGRDSSYRTYRNIDGESNTLIIKGQDELTDSSKSIMSYPSLIGDANLIKVEIIKDGQSYVKTF